MSKLFYIALLGLFLINCTSNTIIKKPDDLVSKDEMANILTDMFLASGGKNIKNIQLKRKVNYFPLVYEKYHIDSTLFKESNFYYVSRIDDYQEILEKIDKKLKDLRKINQDEMAIQDSIKKNDRKIKKEGIAKLDSIKKNDRIIKEDELDEVY